MAISRSGAFRRLPRRDVCEVPTLVPDLLRRLDTKISRRVLREFRNETHEGLIELDVDPASYTNYDLFWRDWLAVNILSKYPNLNLPGRKTDEVAYQGFLLGEQVCEVSNRRLRGRYDTPTLGVSGDSLIEAARQKIARLLGDFSWDLTTPYQGFSGGASTRLARSKGDAYFKFQGKPEVTQRAALLACCAIECVPSWRDAIRSEFGLDPVNWVRVVEGNSITTVPKNAKTDRVIAIEPCLNMYLQKGLGGVIRSRLRKVGIDLNDQTLNQRLACKGSLDSSLSTIDLKAASDTISIGIVERLLPPDWYRALDLVRSERGRLPSGGLITYQKFSSMGNGFTFELESMIFWALASAVVDTLGGTDRRVAVYGDDIIVPTAAAGFLVELLEYCGFATNVRKSFFSGPFRESCGKHYFNGIDVTPIYIRSEINSLSRAFWYANSLRRWASRPFEGLVADARYKAVYDRVVDAIPTRHRWCIPDGIGDGGLISTFSEACPQRRRDFWVTKRLDEGIGRKTQVYDRYAYLRALMHGCVGTSLTDLLVERERTWVKLRTHLTSQWDDAPLWV